MGAVLSSSRSSAYSGNKRPVVKGEVPQYYVEHNHEAIISPQVFDWVQEEIKRRREGKKRYIGVSIFSSKIKCEDCGGWYGAKVWHSKDKYRSTIYRCNDKFMNHCKTPHLTESEIKDVFIQTVKLAHRQQGRNPQQHHLIEEAPHG